MEVTAKAATNTKQMILFIQYSNSAKAGETKHTSGMQESVGEVSVVRHKLRLLSSSYRHSFRREKN
jgi:hypothetical protein